MILLHTIYFRCKITSYTVSDNGTSEKSVTTAELTLIFLPTSLFFTGFTMLTPILPLYITALGASKLELGFMMAILPATSIFTRFPFSVLSIKIGRWSGAISALLLQLISYILARALALVSTILWLTADIALAFGSSLAGTLSIFIPVQSIFRVISMIVLVGLFGIPLINESKSQRRRQ